ncbi:MAG: hypothetical protein ACRDD7_04820 [Peptostreptococcaceae bacterium]
MHSIHSPYEDEFDEEECTNTITYDEQYKVVIGANTLDIDVLEYLDMEKNYDLYLRTIWFFGGFMTYEHLVIALSPKYKRSSVFNTLNDMVDKGYLRKENLGKYNYVILGKKAQIYVRKIPKANHLPKPNQVKMLSRLLLTDYLLKSIEWHPEKFTELMYIFSNYESHMRFNRGLFYISLSNDGEIVGDKELKNISYWEKREIGVAPKFIEPKVALKKQLELTYSDDIKIEHSNGPGSTIKKTYDILGKLELKNVYIVAAPVDDENKVNIEHNLYILILDVDKDNRWFRTIIEEVDHLVSTLYFNAIKVIDKKIKLNFIILTDNDDKVNNIQSYLNKNIKEMSSSANEFIKNNVIREYGSERYIDAYNRGGREIVYWEKNKKQYARQDGTYSGRFDPLYLFWVNEVKVISLNTARFFETRADNIDIITKDTFKIIELK